ncbi:unnamed protein product [Rotaria socialis]|uniref:Phage tail collar domain-containing protein n=1 Tax=Rotaria socialis TaxID=392032 RepID=A0A817Z2L2_9BILA|nr:unnamed protein product [Rotaria socialis]CAF4804769.1 unnamed protein product [Rotaria socialis]
MLAYTLVLIVVCVTVTESIEQNSLNLPVGTIVMFGGDSIPTGWIPCDGSELPRMKYNDLFMVIGTLYGSGDNVRTFNLPDFRERFPLGAKQKMRSRSFTIQGGASKVTLTEAQLPRHSHEKGSLSLQIAGEHSHYYHDPGHDHGGRTGNAPYSGGGWGMYRNGVGSDRSEHSHTIQRDYTRINIQSAGSHIHEISGKTDVAGAGEPFSIMPPYQTTNYIIYFGRESFDNK